MISNKRIDLLGGWIMFIIATVTYGMTVEPSASFWDCSEFITSASKLEVGHPPGAPIFMLAGNLFSHFAQEPSQIAYLINWMNVLLSAGSILFLFWTITALVRKIFLTDKRNLSDRQVIVMAGCGCIGALTYTFSDTFWYSAVEGEVYAFSSFLTALAFWIILKWDEESENGYHDRWLILLSYIIGLSIGVHLLNLLCIPAIGLIFYFKKSKKPSWKGGLMTIIISGAIIAVVLYGIIPGIMKMSGYFELLFVNKLEMGFNSGTMIYFILLLSGWILCIRLTLQSNSTRYIAILFTLCCLMLGITCQVNLKISVLATLFFVAAAYGTFYNLKGKDVFLFRRAINTISLSIFVILLGYSSYGVIMIRAAANPPMNQQTPKDPFSLKDYLGREQYGQAPLVYGHSFISPLAIKEDNGKLSYDYSSGETIYLRKDKTGTAEKGIYLATGNKQTPVYQPETCSLFPRLYSAQHKTGYLAWLGELNGKTVSFPDKIKGMHTTLTIPSFGDNLRFFFRYQLNFMYWRYFFWNFVGRQDDIQGHGGDEHGNWITGIPFFDRILVGEQAILSNTLQPNKGRNVFYGLPFLLGLIGICWQLQHRKQGKRQFWIIFLLFFMTGIAIVLYLNQTPFQARERDYAYAGSFYAFAIWIGLGFAGIVEWLRKHVPPQIQSNTMTVIALLICSIIPIQMASQNWDDHNRSDRYICRDTGYNYLMSLQEEGKPILFVNGDNETFPLWYNIEVEEYRRDTRVCNMMYLSGAWYADQMRRPAYESDPLPISLSQSFLENNSGIQVNPVVRQTPGPDGQMRNIHMKELLLDFYKQNLGTTLYGEDPFEWKNIVKYWLHNPDESMRFIPTDEIHIRIDKEAVRQSGIHIPEHVEIPEVMTLNLHDKSYLLSPGLILIDLIQNCNWKRPLYIAITSPKDEYVDLSDHLIQEGLALRIVPFNTRNTNDNLDTEKLYKNVMQRFRWDTPVHNNIYLDETNKSMLRIHTLTMLRLAENLYLKGDSLRALEVLDKCRSITQTEMYDTKKLMSQLYRYLGKEQTAIALEKEIPELVRRN